MDIVGSGVHVFKRSSTGGGILIHLHRKNYADTINQTETLECNCQLKIPKRKQNTVLFNLYTINLLVCLENYHMT